MILPTKIYPSIEPQILFPQPNQRPKQNNYAVVSLILTSNSPSLLSALVVRNEQQKKMGTFSRSIRTVVNQREPQPRGKITKKQPLSSTMKKTFIQ